MPRMIHVVAAAVIRNGRVLAARRSRPADVAGGWEFPGGKVEAGESEAAALARELAEELGLRAEVRARLGEVTDGRIRLVLLEARSADEPVLGDDHDDMRWLGAAELEGVAWLAIDRELLPAVRALLERSGEG